jgi:circadian clock protein KaiC
MHLLTLHDQIQEFKPQLLVIDPITNLIAVGEQLEVRSMLTRLIDFLKSRQITALCTSLTSAGDSPDQSEVGISSLIDTWISLRNVEHAGERNRALHVLKSRGMPHSNQVREFVLSKNGMELIDVSVRGSEVLVGSARFAQESQRAADAEVGREELARLQRALERKSHTAEAQIAALKADAEADLEELRRRIHEENARLSELNKRREALIHKRMIVNSETGKRMARHTLRPRDKAN